MRRPVHRFGLLPILVIGLFWLPGAFTDPPPRQTGSGDASGKDRKEAAAVAIGRKLATPVSLSLEPGPLREALDLLRDKYGLTILVDQEAFTRDLGLADVVAQEVKLAKVAGVRLETVLRQLTAQVQGGFLVKADHIEITTLPQVQTAVWGPLEETEVPSGVARPRPRMPLVYADFQQRPLDLALRDLTEATGVSILLDARRAGEKGRTAVTATFNNVPLDTAVRLLANQADLRLVLLDRNLYVTTPEHAGVLQPEGANPLPVGNLVGAVAAVQPTVQLKLDGTPLQKVLQDLGRQTGVKVVVDPEASRAAQTPITLDLEGVTAETAVRLLAKMADLKAVPVGNVTFVTTPPKADKLEAERTKDLKLGMQLVKDGGIGGLAMGVGGFSGGAGIGGGMLGLSGGAGTGGGPVVRIGPFTAPVQAELPPRPAAKAETSLHRILSTLAQPVSFKEGIDAKPLKEILDMLRDKYKLNVLVNAEAFKSDLNRANVEGQEVKLPRLTDVRLSTVLARLLAQVQGTFLVRADHLEVTTLQRAQTAIWGSPGPADDENGAAVRQRVRLPVVHAQISNLPLSAALRELADASGLSIILDPHRVGEKAQALVSGPMTNVPVDTAVQLLADQVGLEVVLLDDALYVTTPANARAVRAEQQRANQGGVEGISGAPSGAAAGQ